MARKPFEFLEHTADIGLRAFGKTLPELYENAARGMLELLASPRSVRATEEEKIEVSGADAVDLLVVWLHEILYRFDARKRIFADVRVDDFGEWRISATLKGERLDLSRHELREEIKAVTYHAARVEKTQEGWVAEVVFDV